MATERGSVTGGTTICVSKSATVNDSRYDAAADLTAA
ncbi:uncharacterized protein METZ01_LOCUS292908 [marine metagenome]|uniref:Uncharacterized protein n=1 Tax=marine metagenome TaxID=408172 RepID=A0A382LTI3_9ZZZZ